MGILRLCCRSRLLPNEMQNSHHTLPRKTFLQIHERFFLPPRHFFANPKDVFKLENYVWNGCARVTKMSFVLYTYVYFNEAQKEQAYILHVLAQVP